MSTADKSPTTLPTIFNFETHPIDVFQGDDGEPLFVGRQVCAVLGLHPDRALARLDDDEKGLRITQTPGGPQNVTVLNESGLFNLVLRSRKPETKRFRRWVTHEVLPAIRKTGAYVASAPTRETLPDADLRKMREERLAARELRLFTKSRYDAVLRAASLARAVGDVSPAVVLTLEVRAAEIASGMNLAALLPSAPVGARGETWIQPTQIAAELAGDETKTGKPITSYRVGKTITALGLRTNMEFSRPVLSTATHGDKTITAHIYDPCVVPMIRAKLIEDGHIVALGGAK